MTRLHLAPGACGQNLAEQNPRVIDLVMHVERQEACDNVLKTIQSTGRQWGVLERSLPPVSSCSFVLAMRGGLAGCPGVEHFVATAGFVGLVLEFRGYLLDALRATLKDRIPFVFSSVKDLHDTIEGSSVG
jgi:hypothetical protein